MQITSEKIIHTDVLIIGGGTAGCYAALTLRSLSAIRRSSTSTTPRKTQPASSGKTCSSPCPKASTKSPGSWKTWDWSS